MTEGIELVPGETYRESRDAEHGWHQGGAAQRRSRGISAACSDADLYGRNLEPTIRCRIMICSAGSVVTESE